MSIFSEEFETNELGEPIFHTKEVIREGYIDVFIKSLNHGWIRFTAAANDREEYGSALFELLSTKYADQSTNMDFPGIYILKIENDRGLCKVCSKATVSESGSSAKISYVLQSRPTDDVVIKLGNSDNTEVSLNKTQLVFTASNWSQAQIVKATGLSDNLVDGKQVAVISHQISSNDLNYAPRSDGAEGVSVSDIHISVTDNDANRKIYGDRGDTYSDELSGGNGNDRIFGLLGDDTLSGGRGNDRLMGGDEDDILRGEDGNDKLYGEFGDDKLYGGAGNDLIDGGQGADYMSGGGGNDTYYVDDSGDVIDDRGSDSDVDTIILQNAIRYKLRKTIENATGSTGNDTLIGNKSDNEIIGDSGNDVLKGQKGDDIINGGAGSDKLIGGIGGDIMRGGGGSDTFVIKRGNGHDIIEDFSNRDQINVQGFNDNRVRIEIDGDDALLYAKGDLLARVVDGAGMNII